MSFLPNAPAWRRMLVCVVALGALSIALAACGSSSSGSSSGSSGGAQFQARLNFAKCMRQHGINVPDPSADGGPAGGGGAFRALRNYPQAQRQAALQACQSYLRQAFGNITPAQSAQFRQQLVKYATCMRSHGIDIPDPTAGTTGGFGLRGALRSIDRNSPAFKAANTACGSLRPRFGRGAGGGGVGGGAPGGAPGA